MTRRRDARASAASALRVAVIAVGAAVLSATRVDAQAGLTRVDDASTVPRGFLRVRIVPSWSRFEDRFTGTEGNATSTVPLASVVAAESLGVAQIPGLTPSEVALRTLTGDPTFRLSLGRSVSRATARQVTTAFTAEYGLTRRLTIGAVLPLVQTRTEVSILLNAEGSTNANVGPNPARIPGVSSGAGASAADLRDQLRSVSEALQSRLDACDANPASHPNCATILANRGDVISLIGETNGFGSAVGVLFGTGAADPEPFAPLEGTTAATAIDDRLATLTDRLRGYVGSAADEITASVPFAVGPAGFGDIQRLLLGRDFGLAPDSLGAVYRFSFGDIELGAKFLVLERGAWAVPPTDAPSPWLRTRLSAVGLVRLGTGTPTLERLPHRYLEYGTGDGQTDIEGGVFLDVGLGRRMVVTASARYTAQLGEVGAGRVPDENGVVNPFTPLHGGTRRLGDIFVGELTPQFLLGRYLGADAHYAIIIRGADEYSAPASGGESFERGGFTEQRVGIGLTYSTLRGARGRLPRVPLELSIAHVQTVTGSSALVPRASRQQIGLRLYYRVWR